MHRKGFALISRGNWRWLVAGSLLLMLVISLGSISTGWAADPSIVVNSFSDIVEDNGSCSLREAIIAANLDQASGSLAGECASGDGADTIGLPAGVFILSVRPGEGEDSASSGDLDINSDLTLMGAGADQTTITTGELNDRVFQVNSGNVTISGVTISGGNSSGNGGGILNFSNLTISESSITGNAAVAGGGVSNSELGTLQVTKSTIAYNESGTYGGGVLNSGESATFINSTISSNFANDWGGGLYSNGGTASISYSTITNNSVFAGNGGGVAKGGGDSTQILIADSILANNIDFGNEAPECGSIITSQGHNLVGNAAGCDYFPAANDIIGSDPLLGPLQNNGGGTDTHALLAGSLAIDAGNSATCPVIDQRGLGRSPQACDIGAFEYDPPQAGPIIIVNTNDDVDDGACTISHCSLREAINATNADPSLNDINFATIGTISPLMALPDITDTLNLDGIQPDGSMTVLDGSNAGPGVSGLMVNLSGLSGGSISGMVIQNFDVNGVVISPSTFDVRIQNNIIQNNGGLAIDLGGDGVTDNDQDDQDPGANHLQNFPIVTTVYPGVTSSIIGGTLNSTPDTTFSLEFFDNTSCNPSGYGDGERSLGLKMVTTDSSGNVRFAEKFTGELLQEGHFITATATDPAGNTSEFSMCAPIVGPFNVTWVNALELYPGDVIPGVADHFINQQDQSRWYKFEVKPGSRVIVTLTNLPENYDITVYKDIQATYDSLIAPSSSEDLVQLNAEFAPDVYSPDVYSPDVYSPDVYSPDVYSPDVYSPDVYSPDVYSPDVYSPDVYSPDVYSPDVYSPDVYSPDVYSPDVYSSEAFSGAQARSLIGASAFTGTTSEGIAVNTWLNDGDYYIRVRGRNGIFVPDPSKLFHLEVFLLPGQCGNVAPVSTPSTIFPSAKQDGSSYNTIILTDPNRMLVNGLPDPDFGTLQANLNSLVSRPEVDGVVVDLGTDARVQAAQAQADTFVTCPYAKNLVAGTIKEIIDGYKALNPDLEYIVLIGNDFVIPSFRHPDQAGLANENNYFPPVRDNTPSQATLRNGYFATDDGYASSRDVTIKDHTFPVITDLSVGRVVETAANAIKVIDAYLSNGGVITPQSALATGYDFLEDSSTDIAFEMTQGLPVGSQVDTLITPAKFSPESQDPSVWTADQLRTALIGNPQDPPDLVYLAAHASASSLLAADFKTRFITSELVSSNVDLTNSIIYSIGCHSGYNIVNYDGVPNVTREPDWGQAIAQMGGTLVAGPAYQFGDTEFIKYSEQLYLLFTQQLRTGTGPVSIGQALREAKKTYLAETTEWRGIHEKSLLQTMIFGLPMLSVDMQGIRLPSNSSSSIVTSLNDYPAPPPPTSPTPGQILGLQYADITITPNLVDNTVPLSNTSDINNTIQAFYLSGSNGVVSNPAEPTVPLETRDVSFPGTTVRGAGFRGGNYWDRPNLIPLTGAPTTEIRSVHTPFLTSIFYPVRPWEVNYLGRLADGVTRFNVTPAQFISDPGSTSGTFRQFVDMDYRIFFSSNTLTYGGGSVPALAGPPAISHVSATPGTGNVSFDMTVLGSPSAGIQEVWVTYTSINPNDTDPNYPSYSVWKSLDLTQNSSESTLWQGNLPIGSVNPYDIRYMVQAVNGVGLVGMAANLGQYYIPGLDITPPPPTSLTFDPPAVSQGRYGTQASFSAVLSDNIGNPLPNQFVSFRLGSGGRLAVTDGNGRASANMTIIGVPNPNPQFVVASFLGSVAYGPSIDRVPFTIQKQFTSITLDPVDTSGNVIGTPLDDPLVVATLTDALGRPLDGKTVFFIITGPGGGYSEAVITDYAGRASLSNVPLPLGNYTLQVTYGDMATMLHTGEVLDMEDISYEPTSTTVGLSLINRPPNCSPAYTDPPSIWSVNKDMVTVKILGLTDPEGDPFTITVTGIFQDEPVGKKDVDGIILSGGQVQLRAERLGKLDGRVYHIFFNAQDDHGGVCSNEVRIATVPHDQSGDIGAIDQGPLYDSTVVP